MYRIILLAGATALGVGWLCTAHAASGLTNIYSFVDGNDGGFPESGLTPDAVHHVFYGTTTSGGAGHNGVVFSLAPPAQTGGAWTETPLYSFTGGNDGGIPTANVSVDPKTGAIYGTTYQGGADGYGVVFELTPPAVSGGAWTETVLHTFTGGNDGGDPDGQLIEDAQGNLYGAASEGGTGVVGVVFALSPPAGGQTAWTETVLYNFTGNSDGGEPLGDLVFGPGHALYGATAGYGSDNSGTIYALTRPTSPGGTWGFNLIHTFAGGAAGEVPRAGMIYGRDGNLYGTTAGFASSQGSVFQLIPPTTKAGAFTYNVLYDFSGLGFDGNGPWAPVSMDAHGNLYGTTLGVGLSSNGEIFKLAPPASPGGQWTETVPYYFNGGTDGQFPYSNVVILGKDLFGTTYGAAGQSGFYPGTVWEYQP